MELLIINGHDYSRWVEDQGYDWSRDDLDSEKSVRTKNGIMRRDKLGEKRNLVFKMRSMPQALAAQLDNDLHQTQFTATYHDMHGVQTRQFYCSKFSGKLHQVIDEANLIWDEITFNMHEI